MTKNNPTVQDKIATLRELVAWFDGEEFSLEESVAQFKKAEKLAQEIEHDLQTLKNEIDVVKQSFSESA